MRLNLFLLIGILLSIIITIGFTFHLYPKKLDYLQNFEEDEFLHELPFIKETAIINGLAVYSSGEGDPILLFPYPHAHTTKPMAQSPLAKILVEMGRQVITFDVPGAYKSTRKPIGDMDEMIISALETLKFFEIDKPIDIVGHSMSGLSSLAFSIEHPEKVKSLVQIGSMSGFPAAMKYGLPKSVWKVWDLQYWKFILLGLRAKSGWSNLAVHKELYNLMTYVSFFDKTLFSPLAIDESDHNQGIPIREILWGKNMFRNVSYADKLERIESPTLILVGKFDPEAPVECSIELARGIPDSNLVIFEKSGHYPYIEEEELFRKVIKDFYDNK